MGEDDDVVAGQPPVSAQKGRSGTRFVPPQLATAAAAEAGRPHRAHFVKVGSSTDSWR